MCTRAPQQHHKIKKIHQKNDFSEKMHRIARSDFLFKKSRQK